MLSASIDHVRRKFNTSDKMDRWKKAGVGRVREEKRRKKSQRKEDAGARTSRKVAIHCDVSMICGSGGSKSKLTKAAGAAPSGQMRDEKLHAVVARSTFRSQNVKTHYITQHYTILIALHYTRLQLQLQLQLHYVTIHYTALITLHYTTTTTTATLLHTTLDYTTLYYTTLHHSTLNYSTLHYTTLHYTNYTTPQLQQQLQLQYTNYITL